MAISSKILKWDELGKEGYQLEISAEGIELTGATPAGVFYGGQTLRQCIPPLIGSSGIVPAVSILDQPRLCAFAQTVWSPEAHEPYADFQKRLIPYLQRLKDLSINFRDPCR